MEHLVTLCSSHSHELLAARAIMTDLSLMFLVSTLKEAFDEGKENVRDGWSGRDVGLVTDRKSSENVFKR